MQNGAVVRVALAEVQMRESTLRRVASVTAAVVLVVAGILVAGHGHPELGGALIAAGVDVAIEALTLGRGTPSRHPWRSRPALTLA